MYLKLTVELKRRGLKKWQPLKGEKKKIQGEQCYTEERIKRMPIGGKMI